MLFAKFPFQLKLPYQTNTILNCFIKNENITFKHYVHNYCAGEDQPLVPDSIKKYEFLVFIKVTATSFNKFLTLRKKRQYIDPILEGSTDS